MSESIIRLENVKVEFKVGGPFSRRRITVLNDINFNVNEGEVIGLIGESGGGKTTLGKVMAGLIRPVSGKVLYKGSDIWSMDKKKFIEYRRSVQYLHQDPYSSLNPVHTIYTILSRPLLKYKVTTPDKIEEEVIDLLKKVGLTPPQDFLNRYPHQLSGGQRQRVALARIMSVKPKVLIADEPVSMIDASQRIEILNLLMELKEEANTTIVYITHDIATLRYISKSGRVAVMYLGEIVEIGNVSEIVEKPLHPYTQTLLNALLEPDPKITRNKTVRLKSYDVPSLLNPPSGCRFHTRCPYSIDGVCDKIKPQLLPVDSSRKVACHMINNKR